MQFADVLVVGGGIQGCSTALALARSGVRVTVLERGVLGEHASGQHAGGVRQALRAREEVPLSVAAMAMWHRIEEIVGDNCGFEQRGHLELLKSEAERIEAVARVEALQRDGFDHETIISTEEVSRLIPAVTTQNAGALYSARDGIAEPLRTLNAFAGAASRAGATIVEGCEVLNITKRSGVFEVSSSGGDFSAPRLVNAAGAWAGAVANLCGEQIEIEAIAPMLALTGSLPTFLGPVIGLFGQPLSVKQWPDGRVMIGGGFRGSPDLPALRGAVLAPVLEENLSLARQLLPRLASVPIERTWAALEGATGDNLPIIGASSRIEGLYHCCGFSTHGFQIAPAVGMALAETILTGRLHPHLMGLGAERFHRMP